MSFQEIPERVIGTKAYLPQSMRDFLDTIIHEDAAENVSCAVKWCIDACMRIEKKYGIDACYIAHNDIRLPENDPNPPSTDRAQEQKREGKMSDQLAAEADMAAIDFGQLSVSPDEDTPDGSELTDAYSAGQNWMWRKLQAEISSLKDRLDDAERLLKDEKKVSAEFRKAHAIAFTTFVVKHSSKFHWSQSLHDFYDQFLIDEANKNKTHQA
jgi:hypothetical protein